MRCPKCPAELSKGHTQSGAEIDTCAQCGGTWYDEGETSFKMLVKGLKQGAVMCPRCGLNLWVGSYGAQGGPELDYCTQCGGVWLDRGEAEKIAGGASGAKAPAAPPPQPQQPPPPAAAAAAAAAAPVGGGGASGGGISSSAGAEAAFAAPPPAGPLKGTDRSDYKYTLEAKPDFCFLTVAIPANQKLIVEASAMAAMDVNVKMESKMKGGLSGALSRVLTGESIVVNEFTAEHAQGEIKIAPGPIGDMDHVYLDGSALIIQSGAFVASGPGVDLDFKFQGLKGFFSGEGLFLGRASGKGDLWFNTFGGMIRMEIAGEYIVDTGYVVAFTEGLNYTVQPLGGLKSFFLSGEGFVCRFSGKGTLWIQTRQFYPFDSWIRPFRPSPPKNN